MPTKRALVFLFIALLLYILANQTQVGWVYIMTNGLIALLIVAFFYSRGMLKSIEIQRAFRNLSSGRSAADGMAARNGYAQQPLDDDDDTAPPKPLEFYEDDTIEVTFQVAQQRALPAFLIAGREHCPVAPPDDHIQSFFIPTLFRNEPAHLAYQTSCDRRGIYSFPRLQLSSNGAFTLFRSKRSIAVPGEITVFPRFHPVKSIRLLKKRGFLDTQLARVGASSEIIGTREYRSGDSMRHIHWRSTARMGKPVVKELADNEQLSISVVLDLSANGNVGTGKYAPFETAVRVAASLGYFATVQKMPFRLMGRSERWTPPSTNLSWWGIMNYLAKVKNDGHDPLADVLQTLPPLPFVIVLVSKADAATNQALASLAGRGTRTLAIFIRPEASSASGSPAPEARQLEARSLHHQNWTSILDEL